MVLVVLVALVEGVALVALRRLRLGVREGSAVEVVGGLRGLAGDGDELTDSVLRS